MEFERFLVDASKNQSIKAQISHREHFIHFGPIDATLAGDIEEEYNNDTSEVFKYNYYFMNFIIMKAFRLIRKTFKTIWSYYIPSCSLFRPI